MEYRPFCPVDIRFPAMEEARELLRERLAAPGCLLLASPRAVDSLGLAAPAALHISSIPTNPSLTDICSALEGLRGEKITDIIAIGGGSAIDFAKALAAFLPARKGWTAEALRAALKEGRYAQDGVPAITALPTTSGTGSEVTKWATIWDFEAGEKLSADHAALYPRRALILPALTASLPPRLTLSTGLDALSHALEAFWARATDPLAQSLALDAARQVREHLPGAMENDAAARNGMSRASLLAGLAFSRTRTTASHSISYPLTLRFRVEHGFAAAMTLPQVAEINRARMPGISALLDIFGGDLAGWMASLGLPKLREYGLVEADIPALAAASSTKGRMDNNPVRLDEGQIADILRNCL